MNKKIVAGAGIAVLVVVMAVIGVKTIAGDKAAEVPGEEHMENALHIQESHTTNATTSAESGSAESGSTESSESGP
ncbi:MAG: hypothetical protein KGI27_03325 [Thaumarchaeota archaeon]|nr:hypothetical protein [Nitrososphaerota archaeon]